MRRVSAGVVAWRVRCVLFQRARPGSALNPNPRTSHQSSPRHHIVPSEHNNICSSEHTETQKGSDASYPLMHAFYPEILSYTKRMRCYEPQRSRRALNCLNNAFIPSNLILRYSAPVSNDPVYNVSNAWRHQCLRPGVYSRPSFL